MLNFYISTNMPACLAVGCTNKTGKPLKDGENPKSFHQIPSDFSESEASLWHYGNHRDCKTRLSSFQNGYQLMLMDHFHTFSIILKSLLSLTRNSQQREMIFLSFSFSLCNKKGAQNVTDFVTMVTK